MENFGQTVITRYSDREVGWEDTSALIDLLKRLRQTTEFEPRVIRKVISLQTAERVRDILVMATEKGTGKSARVEDFKTAGKTGTAQKIEANGAYSHSKYIASFIGFAPADDPLIAVVVSVDEPRPYYFGGVVAAPVFKRIAQDAVKYLKLQKESNAIAELAKKD